MIGTIESTHSKLTEKILLVKKSADLVKTAIENLCAVLSSKTSRKAIDERSKIESIHINLLYFDIESIETKYNLSIVNVLNQYYTTITPMLDEEQNTREYYRIITSENFISQINGFILRITQILMQMRKTLQSHVVTKKDSENIESLINTIQNGVDKITNIEINISLEKKNYEICKCGTRMTIVPEYSELHCSNIHCRKIKTIIGAVFRDNQFYPQEGQRTKHGGYDTNRHYKFWSERLQALETTNFNEIDLNNIEYVICRDGHDKILLTCEQMREILKDPKVNATHLNDHAPLLVKTFGGRAPPQLDFNENKLTSIRFNKVMNLYDIINPDGGNKPYYPYFIYKIWEEMFKNNFEKLRLLDYIHLQSRDTVQKNDMFFEKICLLSNPCDGLVYIPTLPDGRI